jgi:hypothetical protein
MSEARLSRPAKMWKSQRELTGFNVALMLWREYVPKEKCSLNVDHIDFLCKISKLVWHCLEQA